MGNDLKRGAGMAMEKKVALEWAEMIREYYDTASSFDALRVADGVMSDITDCIARQAEARGWYPELCQVMGWEDGEE